MADIRMGGALALLLGASMAMAPAHAAGKGVTGPEVVAVLAQMELDPELTTDSVGDPMVKFALDGLHAYVNFYDCNAGTCGSLQLEAAFDLENGMTLQQANVINTRYRYIRIHLDDEMDPFMQYDFEVLHTDHGQHITSQVEIFGGLLGKVAEAIDF
jgi:hypothetical protein